MTLFSWFIKTNKGSTPKQRINEGGLSTVQKAELKGSQTQVFKLKDEINTFNNNTMWPIAKVKTTTMIIKRTKADTQQVLIKDVKAKKTDQISTSLVSLSAIY